MMCAKCFGILVGGEGEGAAQGAAIAESPESHVIAEIGRAGLSGDKFSVSLQGCTSNPTPIWDELGCIGMNREG